jgi:tripartite ATP-independent transporter DctM subunit
MALVGLILTFVVLLLIGVPVAITMFGASLVYILLDPTVHLASVASKAIGGISSYSLLALPLYILTGELMNSLGITQRLFNFPLSLVGHIRGGLAHVNILASMLFAGMSGAAIADTAGLGKIELKVMEDEGYDKGFSAAITAASSTVGPIIPPSNTMVIYAVVAEVSIARLFLGGLLPGLIMGGLMIVYVSLVACKRYNLPTRPRADFRTVVNSTQQAILPLLTPVIIIMGIVTGFTTATEAGAIAVIYALFLGVVYRKLDFSELLETLKRSAYTTIKICFIVTGSAIFGWVVTLAQIPNLAADFLVTAGASKWLVLIIINVGLLFLGCFLSITASILIATPTLVVIADVYNIDLVHLGVLMTLNLTIGLLTPPVGWNLYIVSELAKISFSQMVKSVMPLLIPLLISLLVITYFPQTVIWLPNLLIK